MRLSSALLLAAALTQTTATPALQAAAPPDLAWFFQAAARDDRVARQALAQIAVSWRDGYTPMIVDLARLMRPARRPDAGLDDFLDAVEPDESAPPSDPLRGGVPARVHPSSVIREARYLKPDHVVFGVYSDGVVRAYPKRILAWHELARDRVSGLELTLVYCTLCGTVIPYDSRVGGVVRTFGTSGLLYRSNKLMFDSETRSLWSSLDGAPVIGPLVVSGLQLTMLPVVTTTWGEWKEAHPQTTVLSLDTGFERDYSEGAAYREYFATDGLMFRVPRTDARLKNKAEVLVLRLAPTAGGPRLPVAIAADLLRRQRVYHLDLAEHHLVVITTAGGANRVYRSGSYRFSATSEDGRRVIDAHGRSWRADENHLQAEFDAALRLPRVAANRAFWVGWYAQYPDAVLIR